MVIWSGPAAATRPFFDAMLSSDEVDVGRDDHGVVRRTFASPAIARNPSSYSWVSICNKSHSDRQLEVRRTSVAMVSRSGPALVDTPAPGFPPPTLPKRDMALSLGCIQSDAKLSKGLWCVGRGG